MPGTVVNLYISNEVSDQNVCASECKSSKSQLTPKHQASVWYWQPVPGELISCNIGRQQQACASCLDLLHDAVIPSVDVSCHACKLSPRHENLPGMGH